jgi:hypothetical protein
MGCPEHCPAGTLTTCNVDCLQTSNPTDVEGCTDLCNTCVKDETCWTDFTYGGADDLICWGECYEDCTANFGEASSLCNCASHEKCVFGCPGNCSTFPATEKTCNVDCLRTAYGPVACYEKCNDCINEESCWSDSDYGSTADVGCHSNCYTSCDDYWPTASSLCDCTHNFCTFGCPENCGAGLFAV